MPDAFCMRCIGAAKAVNAGEKRIRKNSGTEAAAHESAVGVAQREFDSIAEAGVRQALHQLVINVVSCA